MPERFDRRVRIQSGPVTLSSEDVEIEGRVTFTEDWVDDVSRLVVQNLSQGTISSLSDQETLTVEAGYEGDTGVILEGRVRSVSTSTKASDDKTVILVGSGVRDFQDSYVSESFLNAIGPQQLIQQMVQRIPTVQVGKIDVQGDPYDHHTVARSAYNEVDGLRRDFDRVAYMRDLSVYVESPERVYGGRERILRPGGILNSIRRGYSRERDEEAVIIETQLSQSLFVGATVTVQQGRLSGTYRVVSGGHSLTDHTTDVVGVEV